MKISWDDDSVELQCDYNENIYIACYKNDCGENFITFAMYNHEVKNVYTYVDGEFYTKPKYMREYECKPGDTNIDGLRNYRCVDIDRDGFAVCINDKYKENLEVLVPDIKDIMNLFKLELLLGY